MTSLFENIQCIPTGDHQYLGQTTLNINHAIIQAHFPGNPIIPGVLLLDLVYIITSKAIGKEIRLSKIGNVKFVRPVIPKQNEFMKIELICKPEESGYSVNANIYYENEMTAQYKNLFYCNAF